MSTMRAVLIKNKGESADDLYIGERPKPVPDSKEVLVKVSMDVFNVGILAF
jgi:NADPH:quinone reductase-like Zn-dependent oxidoreductase